MQRQVWKENMKVKKDEDKEKKEKRKNSYDPSAYPFGADELLLNSELKENEER